MMLPSTCADLRRLNALSVSLRDAYSIMAANRGRLLSSSNHSTLITFPYVENISRTCSGVTFLVKLVAMSVVDVEAVVGDDDDGGGGGGGGGGCRTDGNVLAVGGVLDASNALPPNGCGGGDATESG